MATKKKTTTASVPLSPIEQILAIEFANAKDDKSVISYTCKNGETIELKVKPVLSFTEMHDFVSTVVESVFVDGKYSPIVKSFIINNMIIRHYLKSDADIDDALAVELAYDIDLVSLIDGKIQGSQYFDMVDAIESGIEFKKQELLSVERKFLNESILRSEKMAEQAIQCIEAFTRLATQFEDFDIKSISDAMASLSQKSESEIVKAVLDFNDMKDK